MSRENKDSEMNQPKFNLGQATPERIDIILRNINACHPLENLVYLKGLIDDLFMEACPFLNHTEQEAQKEINEKLNKNLILYNNGLRPVRGASSIIMISSEMFSRDLRRAELELRILLKKHGLLMPKKGEQGLF